MRPMHIDQIGGAQVYRAFRMGERYMRRGDAVTLDELRAMPAANRNVLIEKEFLRVWPKHASTESLGGAMVGRAEVERIICPRGFGRYDVVEGKKLNDTPLSKEAAHALAGVPVKSAQN